MVIPANVNHGRLDPMAIGLAARVKINANIGSSPTTSGTAEEVEKLALAERWGADTVMDLSTGKRIDATRVAIIAAAEVPIGTVPIYQALERVDRIEDLSAGVLLEVIEHQARQGVARRASSGGIVQGMSASADIPLATAGAAVGLPVDIASRLEVGGRREMPEPRFAVEDVGVACIAAALLAAARLREARTGEWLAPSLDRGQARAALVSERLFRVEGEPGGGGFAPASRFWQAADGWVRTHANYPWHHAALLRAVGAADDDALAAAIASRPAEEVEEAVFAAGGVAAKVRTAAEWREHPQGAAVAAEPLVERLRLADAPPRCSLLSYARSKEHRKPPDLAPAAGVRVLDLTRVIAGPVCARYLGALGADVLRLDPPDLPDLEPGQSADTLLGKRSAFLDLRAEAGARRLDALLADADVVLLGYRPGALARFGLAPEELAARHPGLVVMELAAWGHAGPWRERRGFDSIVQAASGIAAVEAGPDGTPGALPCQLLDHGTGYLAAAAVLTALAEQRESGGTHLARLSLARSAHWLLGEGDGPGTAAPDPRSGSPRAAGPAATRPPWHEGGAAFGTAVDDDPSLTAVPPPGSLGAASLRWRGPMARYGAAEPFWR